jgi:hypothetical protein
VQVEAPTRLLEKLVESGCPTPPGGFVGSVLKPAQI